MDIANSNQRFKPEFSTRDSRQSYHHVDTYFENDFFSAESHRITTPPRTTSTPLLSYCNLLHLYYIIILS